MINKINSALGVVAYVAFSACGMAADPATGAAVTGPVTLFGVSLATGTCQQLRNAIAGHGGKLIREPGFNDISVFLDFTTLLYGTGMPENKHPIYRGWIYDSSKLLKDSDELEVGCLENGAIVGASYRFPGYLNLRQVVSVMELVSQKYGPSQGRQGNPDDPDVVRYEWRQGEIGIIVFRGWPQTTTYLHYNVGPNLRAWREEKKRRNAARDAKRAQEQHDAF